jgi:hypothetical protein
MNITFVSANDAIYYDKMRVVVNVDGEEYTLRADDKHPMVKGFVASLCGLSFNSNEHCCEAVNDEHPEWLQEDGEVKDEYREQWEECYSREVKIYQDEIFATSTEDEELLADIRTYLLATDEEYAVAQLKPQVPSGKDWTWSLHFAETLGCECEPDGEKPFVSIDDEAIIASITSAVCLDEEEGIWEFTLEGFKDGQPYKHTWCLNQEMAAVEPM